MNGSKIAKQLSMNMNGDVCRNTIEDCDNSRSRVDSASCKLAPGAFAVLDS
jgi:hypothetical protein